MDYIYNNFLVLLSLFVAFLGGVPGIISSVSYFRNKPEFYYYYANITIAQMDHPSTVKPISIIFLSGTIVNKGPQPLSPERFELEIDIDGQWKSLERMLIPEGFKFSTNDQGKNIQLENPREKDIHRFDGPIMKGWPLRGFLLFVSPDLPLSKLKEAIDSHRLIRITCIDIAQKSHSVEFRPDGHDVNMSTIYPMHGMSINKET